MYKMTDGETDGRNEMNALDRNFQMPTNIFELEIRNLKEGKKRISHEELCNEIEIEKASGFFSINSK